MSKIVLPELGEGIEKAVVACWHFKVGDHVHHDDDVLEVVTDKASFNISAECAGIIKEIFTPEGKEVRVGEALASIEQNV